MSYRPTGFTDYVNPVTYGLKTVAAYDYGFSYPIGSATITSGYGVTVYSAANIGEAVVSFSSGVNFADLWTTITAYTASSVNSTLTSVAVDGSNNVTILLTNTGPAFVVGQQITFSSVATATFLNGVTLSVTSASPTQIVASASGADGSVNSPFTHGTYGPTADTGTITGAAYLTVGSVAASNIYDNFSGKPYLFHGHNANTGGFPSFTDCVPFLTAAINEAAATHAPVYIPGGIYAYNSQLAIGPGGLDPNENIPAIIGAGSNAVYFVANNPASATPMGFMTFTDLLSMSEVSGFTIFGNGLPIGTQPTSPQITVPAANAQPPWAELTVWTQGDCGDIYITDTPFTYGAHVRLTQGGMYDINDFAVSYLELDGATADNCTASAQVFSADAPGTLVYGGEGGLARQCGGDGFSYAHTTGLFSALTYSGFASGNNNTQMFENTVCTGQGFYPYGWQVRQCTVIGCTSEDLQIGFLAGSGTLVVNPITGQGISTAVVSSEGQVPWMPNTKFFGPGVATVTSIQVEHAFGPGPEGLSYTLVTVLAPNSFQPGTPVTFFNIGTASFLNGKTFMVYTSSVTGFTAVIPTGVYDHANYGPTADTGSAIVGQYVIDPAGHKQIVVTPGTSQTPGPPTWNDAGSTTTDGTITWQDLGVGLGFAGAFAAGIKVEGAGSNGSFPSVYAWWNAAYNAEFSTLGDGSLAGGLPNYSLRSPIILAGLTVSELGLVVYDVDSGVQELLVKYYLSCTTAGLTGTVTPTFNWTDDAGHAQSFMGTPLPLNATGFVNGVFPVTAGSSTVTVDLTVASSTGSPVFAAYVSAK